MISRRDFLKFSAPVTAMAFLRMPKASARGFLSSSLKSDSQGILALPKGFTTTVLQESGATMSDGFLVAGRPDGMACFPGPRPGTVTLMRNHEVDYGDFDECAYPSASEAPPEAYNPNGCGGVTRLVIDITGDQPEVVYSNLALAGSVRNCAGGISPWGWLTCEETLLEEHGYVFLCDHTKDRVQPYFKIPNFGRFNHEAATTDPDTFVTYLSEDRSDGCFYRCVPHTRSDPFHGEFQAMRVVGRNKFKTYTGMKDGQELEVDWVTVPGPNPKKDTVRQQAKELGAAVIRRGEGLWLGEGGVFLCSTSGGPAHRGQIFHYRATGPNRGIFKLITQSYSRNKLDMPDNITVAPWGDLYMAEDGGGSQFVRVLDSQNRIHDFARNLVSRSEFTGVCFSPDGSTMFLNIQHDGLTLAVQGPFTKFY